MRSSSLAGGALFAVAVAANASNGAGVHCSGAAGSAVDALLRTVERSALYRALAATAPLVACEAVQAGERTTLAFRFGDGGSLRVERENAVEYTSQEARVGTLFRADPVAVLEDAERSAFGPAGCGIDWHGSSSRTGGERSGARVSVFPGGLCNCQARIARDAHGDPETLALRSAC